MANGLPTTFEDLFIKAVTLGRLKYDFFEDSDFAFLKTGVIPGRKSGAAESVMYFLEADFQDFLVEKIDAGLTEESYHNKYLNKEHFKQFLDHRDNHEASIKDQLKVAEQKELEEWGVEPEQKDDGAVRLNPENIDKELIPSSAGLIFKGKNKIDLIRILNALYEMKYFYNSDGSYPTKEKFMREMGDFFGIDLSKYDTNLSQAFMEGTPEANVAIFQKMMSLTTTIVLEKKEKKS